MEEFVDFEGYMKRVECWGMRSGIVKIVPPQEWSVPHYAFHAMMLIWLMQERLAKLCDREVRERKAEPPDRAAHGRSRGFIQTEERRGVQEAVRARMGRIMRERRVPRARRRRGRTTARAARIVQPRTA